MKAAVFCAVTVLAMTAAFAQPKPAQPKPAQPKPAQPTGLPGSTTGVTVLARGSTDDDALKLRLTVYDQLGLPIEGTRVTVELVTYASALRQGEEPRLTGIRTITSDIRGNVPLRPAAPRTLRAVRFTEVGQTSEVRLPGTGVAQVGIYRRALTDDDVNMDVRGNLSVRDSGASTWLEYTIVAAKPGVRAWTAASPLILPLLAPVVRKTVIDRGAITPATKDIDVQTRDAIKVERAHGGLALIGTVAPGRSITVRVHYTLAIGTPIVNLGLRGVVGKTTVSVATIAAPQVLIEMSVDRAARIAQHEEGRERYTGASIVHPLKHGEIVRIRLVGFPADSSWPGRALGGFAAVMVLVFGAFTFRSARNDP